VWQGSGATAEDIKDAVTAAQAAFPGWAATALSERIAIVEAFAAAVKADPVPLARRIALEMGKAMWDAQGEVQSVVGKAALSIAAQQERAGEKASATPFGETRLGHRPHGVLAVLGPFNFPAHLPNGHIMPALLAGNTVVFKPSEFAPGVGAMMAALWEKAGLPKGVFNLVQGDGEVGRALVQAEGVAGVLFTGSADAGAAIHRHFAGRPAVLLALEMGGNAPLIVWPPADPTAAANLIAHSAFITSGQRCTCARRLILPQGDFGDAVIAALKKLMGELKVGPADADPFLGPVVSVKAAERLMTFQAELLAAGGQALVPMTQSGAFLTPGLIDMTAGRAPDDEAFGPLLQVYRVTDLEAAIQLANATRFGLAAGVVCDEASVWEAARGRLRAGVLNWNRPTTGASGALPFGGPGASGNLRPSAAYAADYCAYPVAQQIAPKAEALPAPGMPA
jgi:succinylglutamic semialdehyde dehydrogenase